MAKIISFTSKQREKDVKYLPAQEELDKDAERILKMRSHPEKFQQHLVQLFYAQEAFRKYVSFYMSENHHRYEQVSGFIEEQISQIEKETGKDLSLKW